MTHDLVSWLRACATNEPSNDDAAKLWGAADLIESLRADLAEQKAAHGDCIKRNIALAGENAALRAEKDELRKALEPFAKYETADGLPCGLLRAPDRHPILFNGLGDEIKIVATIGDFRRAAAAIRNMGERT